MRKTSPLALIELSGKMNSALVYTKQKSYCTTISTFDVVYF
jgi:hypothetical protein